MSRAIRFLEAKVTYYITCTCADKRKLMASKQNPSINELIGGILSKAVEKYGVELFGFVFMPSEYNMLVKGPDNNPSRLAAFFQYLNGQLGLKLNRVQKRSGPFFRQRYHAAPVLDESAFQERLQYIENLARKFDGLSSIPESSGKIRTFTWRDWSGRRRNQAKDENYLLRVRRPPVRRADDKRLTPFNKSMSNNKRKKVTSYATSKEKKKEYSSRYRTFVVQFKEASARLRIGDTTARFPEPSFRPVLRASWIAQVVAFETPQMAHLEKIGDCYEGMLVPAPKASPDASLLG